MGDKAVSVQMKKRWKLDGQGMSLREFARELASKDDKMAKDWFDHKKGSLDQAQSDKNKTQNALIRAATKMNRSNKSSKNKGGKKKAEEPTTTPGKSI